MSRVANDREIESSRDFPSSVYLCNDYNSTIFTACCHVAIIDREQQCPSCKKFVYGWDYSNPSEARWRKAYRPKEGGAG